MRWLVVFVVACGGGGESPVVGEMCELAASPNEIAISTGVTACSSRLCLHVLGNTPDLCTAQCDVADDCAAVVGSPCTAGFECAPVLSVGSFACQKLCVCADRVPATSCP
jgi:hypothetical protein